MIVLGMLVLCNLFMSVCRCTVSNTFDMSRAIAMVRSGGCFLLNPVVMMLLMVCRAVVVECLVRKPCWCDVFCDAWWDNFF